MLKIALTCFTCLLLTGCAENYVLPSGANTSIVKFSAKDIGSINNAYFLLVKPGPTCHNNYGQSLARLGAAINRDAPKEFERPVESGNDIRIFAHFIETPGPGITYQCKGGARMNLLPGHRYELDFRTARPCSLELRELNTASNGTNSSTIVPIIPVSVQTSKELCDL